jgi:carbon monoxide dehydrogenase subunit G
VQLHFDGSASVGASRETVYALLTDPRFIAKNLPDAEDAHVVGESSLEATLRMRIAVVSSKLRVKMGIVDKESPTKATMVADGSGSGSTVKIRSTFILSEEGGKTAIGWSADAEITGVMAGIGLTLMKGYATKKVAEIFEGITKAIEEQVERNDHSDA